MADNKTILIIDDGAHIRVLMEQTLENLEDEGLDLLTTSNGAEPFDMIQTENPDFVFLDVMMPKLNGFEVCQTVKGDVATQSTYVIMLTAKSQDFEQQRGREVGADLYVTKPSDPDEILDKATEVLGLD
ncbi:MAG: response regulator [Cyanobacteria bacterium P01_A01_bin.116]